MTHMDFPAESYLRSVEGDDNIFAFAIPMEAKALESGDTVSVEENGDLILEGYAAVWEGDDREGENFAPGAFERAAKSFLKSPAALCFHHKHDKVLGKVLDLQEDGKGLRMRARVDGAIKQHPELGTYYEQIKAGTLSGLSVGGFFKRAVIEGKRRIADMDFTEISVTSVPVHARPSFEVVAGKALDSLEVPATEETAEVTPEEANLIALNAAVEKLEALFGKANESVSN
jgi:HK97 family phage prohead protease